MNLNNVRHGELKEEFDAIEEAFGKLGIDFYLIGAIARELWYAKIKKFRSTKDVDFAVLVGNEEQYAAVREYLITNKNFSVSRENAFVLIAPSGIQADILPFGEIADGSSVTIAGSGMTNISVDGFMEVHQTGTEVMSMDTGHQFKVATLPAIVLLKLIAFDDRPEKRIKDARDIANIIQHFFELQTDLIYNNHADLFTGDESLLAETSLPQISGVVIGREIKQIAGTNQQLLERLTQILTQQVSLAEKSSFIRNMVEETSTDVEEVSRWLNAVLQGLS